MADHEYFTISPQQSSGTKYYLTASSSEVTLNAEKDEKADFPDTQLWSKKEAFFLFSKSKPEYALVERKSKLHPPADKRPSSTHASARATTRPADSQIELLRPPAMDGGLWTASDDLGGGFIYIQESDLGKGLIYIQKASDAKLVFGEVPARTVELRPKPTGSDPNHEPTSRWKIEPLERKAQAAIGASGSDSHTDSKRTGEGPACGDPKKTDCTAAQAAIGASGSGSHTDSKRTGEDTAGVDPKKTDCTAAQAAIGASGSGSHTDSKRTGEDTAGVDPKKTDCTAGTDTPPMENTQEAARRGTAKQAAREFFTISQQQPCGTKYYLTASAGRDVTLKAEKAADPNTQLWSKEEVFFLFSKSQPALVEQKKDENQKKDEKQKKADNRAIELRPPAMDGLWTESHPVDELIYIQKASDTNLVLDAVPNAVELQQKRTGINPKPTSLWKVEPWKPEAQAAIGASVSGSHTDGKHTGEDPPGGDPNKTGCPAAAGPSISGSNLASRHDTGKKPNNNTNKNPARTG